ncbi:hypothetical protein JXA05_00845 [Candidatus Peregrinibacteria bacterium]|nr:hypothetical protein [Candidatus Peregrinibacteria bacterium]
MVRRTPENQTEDKELHARVEAFRGAIGKLLRKSPWLLIPAALYAFFRADIIPIFPDSDTRVPPAIYLQYHYGPVDHSADEINSPSLPPPSEGNPPPDRETDEKEEERNKVQPCRDEDDCRLA